MKVLETLIICIACLLLVACKNMPIVDVKTIQAETCELSPDMFNIYKTTGGATVINIVQCVETKPKL